MSAGIFTRIINGEIPCHKIAETQDCLAFLDINPLTKGHTLVIPKREIDYFFDLDAEVYITLHLFAKEVAKALLKSTGVKRIGSAVAGFEVAHAHLHLIPLNSIDELNFNNQRLQLSGSEFEQIASHIRSFL